MILAATLSIGAILICVILNIRFNFAGIITDSYRDNMGYSKLVPYNILNGKQNMERRFFLLLGQTLSNFVCSRMHY